MKKITYIIFSIVMSLSLYNCEDAPSLTVPPANFATFESSSSTALVELNGTGSLDIMVYSTRTTGSERTFDVSIDATSSADPASYNVPSSVTIPANSNEGTLSLSFTDTNISNSGETLILMLSADQDTFVSEPIEINVLRDCPSNLEGDYVYTTGNGKSVTIEKTGSIDYTISGDSFFTTDYPFYISDICNEITVTGAYIEDNFGIATSGYGSVDPDTGNITLYYTVDGYTDNLEMILERQ